MPLSLPLLLLYCYLNLDLDLPARSLSQGPPASSPPAKLLPDIVKSLWSDLTGLFPFGVSSPPLTPRSKPVADATLGRLRAAVERKQKAQTVSLSNEPHDTADSPRTATKDPITEADGISVYSMATKTGKLPLLATSHQCTLVPIPFTVHQQLLW